MLMGSIDQEFCIVVPCNSTPYERCSKGRVRHSVTARAKGIGQMGGEIVSEPAELFLMVNVSSRVCPVAEEPTADIYYDYSRAEVARLSRRQL